MHRLATCLLLLLPPFAAIAQAAAEQRIEITGSSIKRIDAESALPVQVLTREQIERTGATSVEQLMQTIASMTSSGANLASSAAGATTGSISSVSLRGLSSLRTLVLVNGRRMAPYGIGFSNDSVSVDVNSIPLAAIERIEVLKDGASAVYGSDAIAGVVNFILRSDYRGAEITLGAGAATQGGAGQRHGSIAWGKGDLANDGWNLLLVASAQKEKALFGRERDFALRGWNEAANNDTTSGNTFPANVAAADGSFGSVNPSYATGCQLPYSFVDPLFPPGACRFDPSPLLTLLPEVRRASLFGAWRVRLGAGWEAFAEASFTRNETRTVVQPVPLSDQFTLPANNPLYTLPPYAVPGGISTSKILLTPASPYYPTAFVAGITGGPTPDLLVRYRSALTGNRDITDISQAPRFAAGVRGSALGWDLDAALLRSESRVREHDNDGWPVLSKVLPLLNSGRVNFFGPNTPDVVAELRATNFNGDAFRIRSALTSAAVKGTRDLLALGGGPLALALGAEAREERYRFEPSPEMASGDIAGYGGNIAFVDRKRTVGALFGELALPLTATLEASAAVRHDRYQGVGSSTTPKLGLRWQPLPALLLRGAVGRGFRAPSLADLYAPATTGVTTQGQSDPVRCPVTGDGIKDCLTQFPTTVGGNEALTPEKSSQRSVGLVLEPVRGLTVGVDLFHIRLTNTIAGGITPEIILGDLSTYGRYVTRGSPDPAFPGLPGPIAAIDQRNLNLGEVRLSGADFEVRWRGALGELGRLAFDMSGTYFRRYDTQNPDGSFTGGVDQVNAATGGVVPRLKTYQSLAWQREPWEATLALQWQKGYHDLPGTFEDPSDPAFQPRRVGSYTTLDTQLGWTGWPGLKLVLGVRNLLDRDPPYSNAGGQTSFQGGYDPTYADPRGRFVYLKATYAFR
jgi:iron complex outermembrane recepter protein